MGSYWGYRPYLRPYTHEVRDIILSLIVMTIAFAELYRVLMNPLGLLVMFVAVVTGFLGHELMHRQVARRLGYIAYFRAWYIGLLLALVTSFIGFIIALPGATVIGPKVWGYGTRDDELKIALAGPATNIVFAVLFLIPALLIHGFISTYLFLIYGVNAWLGLFNLLPIALPGIYVDGFRIFRNNVKVWAAAFAIAVVIFIVGILLGVVL
ncbi:peptidase M50 [Vulcanisaeta thermophila]|uniref:peptidase M50 n=1 Tax=Vulcanisaeta thermophila TaxID=867917 RepID=UPI0008535BC9|nr:peptidase M50 [Vulcanisaeta thermophila]